jgi:hypothetical protein
MQIMLHVPDTMRSQPLTARQSAPQDSGHLPVYFRGISVYQPYAALVEGMREFNRGIYPLADHNNQG